ncbi:hypothetical protein ICE98_02309 [Lactococcus lactis]|nr:hypothetical protein [Lactococcus lactis]
MKLWQENSKLLILPYLASWVNHFKIYGEVPISKKRGWRKKLESIASSMTQNPNDSQRIKELEQELRYAQIEVAYLKGFGDWRKML